MNLKYYLRGLGFGILVTALILGLAGNGKKTMTDAEIKKRAYELGMIENTVLTEETPAKEDEEEMPADQPEEQDETKQVPVEDENDENASEEAEEMPVEDGEVHADETEAVRPEEESEGSGAGAAEADPAAEEPPQTAGDEDQMNAAEPSETAETFVLTIVHGDSSYSVAQKLYDMGIVPSVGEYDGYLCRNGYDRGIRAGTYEIAKDMTPEQIARLINGK